ncbi:MAG: flagellar basal body P-ring formation protein FlgA [Rhodocyclales bacterium]|nr:flagellar basal body P-ring formation protein FlgA [Rhodocyclales bacterium]
MKLGVPAFAIAVLLLAFPARDALARQDPAAVRSAIDTFLRAQVRGLPGEVNFTIGGLDPKNRLAPCGALEVSMPAGAKAWGRTSVSVRCQEPRGWTIFVPVHIRVVTDYLVTAMPLAQGQAVTASDLARQRGDLSDLPAGILTDEREALGRTATMSVAAGRPLRADMLRPPIVIQQNQTVKVVSRGPGFQVANEGRALTNGLEGQIVQVRLASGQVVSGVARTGGIVEIGF